MVCKRICAALTCICVVALICLAPVTEARTWTVERDGSGEFSVIQEAVDAAASGDTIRIGVGRFDEKRYYEYPGWSDSVRVVVHQEELTIIGSGPGTIIGQEEPWEQEQSHHKGIVAATLVGNSVIRVQNLRLENMAEGIYTSHEGQCMVEVRDCTFYANHSSLYLLSEGDEAQVIDCFFDQQARDGMQIAAAGQSKIVVRGCTLRLAYYDHWPQMQLNFNGVQEALIEDCEFLEGAVSTTFSYGGPALIRNSLFDGQRIVAVASGILSNVTLDGCTFRNQNSMFSSTTGDNQVLFTDCVVENVSDSSFRFGFVGKIAVHGCDLARGERGVVWINDHVYTVPPDTLDFTDNYWGTDNPDSIQAWIRDRNDSEDAWYYIKYEPFRTESTPVESQSLSDVRGLFR